MTVPELRAYTGSGWLGALCGTGQTVPGLGVSAAARGDDLDEERCPVGLF